MRFCICFISLILLIMMGEINCGPILYAAERPERNGFERVLTVPWGMGVGQLTNPKDTTGPPNFLPIPVGPSGFWLDGDGRIYIVDAYKSRVMIFKEGRYENSLNINSKYPPVDVIVWHNNIIVLDSISLIRPNAQGLGTYERKISGLFESHRAWRIMLLGNKLMLSSDQYAGSTPLTFAVSGRIKCLDALSFDEAPCDEWDSVYGRNEILDVDIDNYLYFSSAEEVVGVASFSSSRNVVLTKIKTDDYYERINYEIGSLFRLKGDFIYILRSEKKGISILRYKWN